MAFEVDLFLDLHCVDELMTYSCLHTVFWPAATNLAESFGFVKVYSKELFDATRKPGGGQED